jgi:DNA-directed RNA polymerase specialized sigma24 family protein
MPLLATKRFSQAAQTHPAFSIQHRSGVDYASWFIQCKVEGLAGKYTFSSEDGEDIFQDLALYLIRQWPLYQPDKGKPTTFIQNIVNQRVAEMLRNDQRLRRNDSEDVRLSFACEYGILDGVRGQPDVPPQALHSLSLDCEEILSKLPAGPRCSLRPDVRNPLWRT